MQLYVETSDFGFAVILTTLNSIPSSDAFGTDIFEQLADLLFGSDSSEEDGSGMIVTAKPNASVTVLCENKCNLNVTCINCMKVDSTMMNPAGSSTTTPAAGTTAAASGGATTAPPNGAGGGGGGGGGNGATTSAEMPTTMTTTVAP
nr:protein YELLOW LEAF 1, choloroplastic-like [Aedes albopictus]